MTEQQPPGTISKYTPAALAGAVVAGLAAFMLSMFGFSDRLNSLSAKVDALQAGQASREADIRHLSDGVWELRREIGALRQPRRQPEGKEE